MLRPIWLLLPVSLLIACGSAGGFPDERDAGVTGADGGAAVCSAQSPDMTFFFTHQGNLSGDFGGLAGADAFCQQAAAASGIARTDWFAYMSSMNDPTFGRVDARDRIGTGPWFNYCGVQVGDLDSIHSNGIAANLMRAENGFEVTTDMTASLFDRGHDILTGSDPEGLLIDPQANCADWTSSSSADQAWVGHEDTDFSSGTWNNAHLTDGCDEASLAGNLGIGRVYCFSREVVVPRDGGVRDGGDDRDAGVRDAGDDRDAGTRDAGRDGGVAACTPDSTMSFFFTEQGSGPMGGNLGGLAGADTICQNAATQAGAGGRTWRAYLSTMADTTFGRVDARDRIGTGPWFNYDGTNIGSMAEIHHEGAGLGIPANLQRSECGFAVSTDMNASLFERAHDILTGSDEGGRLFIGGNSGSDPVNCNDWTSSAVSDQGYVGHEDTDFSSGTWNSAHPTDGCDESSINGNLGIGRIYCFAID